MNAVTPPVQTPTKATATVGATGGKVATSDGAAGVEIPAGALPNNVQVSVETAPTAPPPPAATTVGTPIVFGPSGLQFTQPVTIVLELDPTKLPPGKTAADIVVFTAPEGTTTFSPLTTAVRDATHVTAQTTHFSVFVPTIPDNGVDAGPAPESDAGGTCTARLCGFYGPGTCGAQDNGCNGTLDCGTCSGGGGGDGGTSTNDDAGGPPAGDGGTGTGGGTDDGGGNTCTNPLTCANYEKAQGPLCGTFPDGCGGQTVCSDGCNGDAGAVGNDGGSAPPAICGDGVIEPGESCDDGNPVPLDGCSDKCQIEAGYQCDGPGKPCQPIGDGGTGGGASDASLPPANCGDAKLEAGETCDDGNTTPFDGCDSSCNVEAGWQCPVPGAPCKKEIPQVCGDAIVEFPEQCDDGNTKSADGCTSTCTIEQGFDCPNSGQACVPAICGNAIIDANESCDDGNTASNDGCSATCQVEAGYTCPNKPGFPCFLDSSVICGDAKIEGFEGCDDGNTKAGDGCDGSCNVEQGYFCPTPGQACTQTPTKCGDGILEAGEKCDDGNLTSKDGCDANCQLEPNYTCPNPGKPCLAQ